MPRLMVIFFWKCKGPYDYLSNWYISQFKENDIVYSSVEQYMMSKKATLFDDHEAANKILSIHNPSRIKKIGRNIKNFKQNIWDSNCEEIVYNGCLLKFIQNEDLMLKI